MTSRASVDKGGETLRFRNKSVKNGISPNSSYAKSGKRRPLAMISPKYVRPEAEAALVKRIKDLEIQLQDTEHKYETSQTEMLSLKEVIKLKDL